MNKLKKLPQENIIIRRSTMKVPFLDIKAQYQSIKDQQIEYIALKIKEFFTSNFLIHFYI